MKRSDFRTTISLSKVVWAMAEQMVDSKGFNENFSAYVADLIRRDQERTLGAGGQLHDAPSAHPPLAPATQFASYRKRRK